MTSEHAAPRAVAPAAPWTRVYWPVAVGLSVAALICLPRWTGWAVLGGGVVLLGPEFWFLARRQWASTLSDWTWHVLDVTRSQPISKWKAAHFLAFAAYLAVAVRVAWYLTTLAGLWHWRAAAGAAVAAFLTWHLFFRWWR